MKYRVFVAEDEPPLLRNIINKIHKLDGECEVVGQAFNGEDALAEIVRLQPDILITDIRMPILDGLKLVKNIKDRGLSTICVILSGYQEFEYAKQAIQLGVEDYILKPLRIEVLSEVLGRIKAKINDQRYNRGYAVLNKIINLNADYSLNNSLEEDTYGIIFLCINNPLGSFHGSIEYIDLIDGIIKRMDIENSILDSVPDLIKKWWILDGKFPNEKIIVAGMNDENIKALSCIAETTVEKFKESGSYITITFNKNVIRKENIAVSVRKLQRIVRESAIVGKNQILSGLSDNEPRIDLITVYSDLEKRLVHFCQNGQIKLLKNEIYKVFEEWSKEAIPKRVLEINLKHIIRICLQNVGVLLKNSSLHMEEDIDRIFLENNNMDSILSEFFKNIDKLFDFSDEVSKDDNELLVDKIVKYLNSNLAKKVSLQEIAEVFGITEPCLSRIFKKYKGESPIDYLLKLRIEKAKQYISDYPEMMLKDIAYITGFSDQYYFSRVFKSITGKSPTEYREN